MGIKDDDEENDDEELDEEEELASKSAQAAEAGRSFDLFISSS